MLALALDLVVPPSVIAYEPCGVRLGSLGAASARPGDRLALHGSWGERQGPKIAVINKGTVHRLEVVEWRADTVTVRLPADLAPGRYRVGVYCNELSEGSTYSSGFADFRVLASDPSGVAADARPPAGGYPDDPDPAQRARHWLVDPRLTPATVGWAVLAATGALAMLLAAVVAIRLLARRSRAGRAER